MFNKRKQKPVVIPDNPAMEFRVIMHELYKALQAYHPDDSYVETLNSVANYVNTLSRLHTFGDTKLVLLELGCTLVKTGDKISFRMNED